MKFQDLCKPALMAAAIAAAPAATATPPRDYPITPVPLDQVAITDGFWRQRLDAHFQQGIDHALDQCHKTGRLDNFVIAAGLKEGGHQGAPFNDSDVYKILEGMAYSTAGPLQPAHRKFIDKFIATLGKAQREDGYLFTFYQVKNEMQNRWTNIEHMHELYCAGHLFEAGAAHFRMTGRRELLDICLKFADHIDRTFGPGRKGNPPGHQEIEMALADLYRITGERKYLDLGRFFLEQRGVHPGNWYHQEHIKLLDGSEAVGHAVRAVYGFCGMAEIAALTGEEAYAKALDRYWHSVTDTKMALSGGIGGGLWESFDKPYFLPNRSSYNETCGSIAQVLWNHRMFRLTGDAKYLDVLERALYNGVLTGVQLTCDAFFYPNPLETGPAKRQPWFDCACCPSNIARILPAQPGYLYATKGDTLFACLYAASDATVKLAGAPVKVVQKTAYPWDGKVAITVTPQAPKAFAFGLRIPGWARNQPVPGDLYRYLGASPGQPVITVNGQPAQVRLAQGFATLERTWQPGDTVTLELPMAVRKTAAHDKVRENAGRVALERGPLVYCVEGLDNGKLDDPHNLLPGVEAEFKAEFRPDLLGCVTVLTGPAELVRRGADRVAVERDARQFTAVPYFARANREPSPMAVFLLRDPAAAILPPVPSLATRSKASSSTGKGDLAALCNQITPARSADTSRGLFVWDDRLGTTEWVQYEFPEATEIRASAVYWYDRFGTAQRLPKAWRLLYRDGGQWKPVATKDSYGLATDTFNTVNFNPVKTDALRLEADLQDDFLDPYLAIPSSQPGKFSAGILEWTVK
ncbi:MAG: glycoside hydrolase family 127 protein [Akkermansiaceae bacterium]|nr:glycoside hydrolase family 127 protein [Akkermansiaceae bacterium]